MPTIICHNYGDEAAALTALRQARHEADTKAAVDTRFIGYNIIGFDAPVLETRALLLGLPSFALDIRKYGSRDLVDMMAVLTFNGECGKPVLSRGQRALATRLGVSMPADPHDGSEVAALYSAGDYDAIAQHCAADLCVLRELYRRKFGPKARGILVDLETVPDEHAADYRAFVRPDSRLKDHARVEADIDDKLASAGLDPWLCRIVCLGYEVL